MVDFQAVRATGRYCQIMASRRPTGSVVEFRRLPPGQHGLGREAVESNQRDRLQRAMIAAVAEHGYAKTKIRDLARLAGVSPNAVYELYANKEEYFLAAHDTVAQVAIDRVSEAGKAGGDWRERLHAAFEAFIETVIAEPQAAYLAVVETHVVGPRALEHQQRALDTHERMLRKSLTGAPHGADVSDMTIKAIIAGTRSVVYHHLSAGHPAQLRTAIEPLFEWVLDYHTPAGRILPKAPHARNTGGGRLPRPAAAPASQGLGHRERIMRAVAGIASESGYAALTMPAITSRAGVSNQTFYEHFRNKHEAFIACYDRVTRRALGATLASFQAAPDWPQAIHASMHTLLGYIAAEPEFARLAFFEVLAAGPTARRRAEARMEAFSAILDPGFVHSEHPPPRLVIPLVAGGVWGVLQYQIMHGQTKRLQELTPHVTYFALTPFIGAERAAQVAATPPPSG
jgi:AcrR family transcriptional regulator